MHSQSAHLCGGTLRADGTHMQACTKSAHAGMKQPPARVAPFHHTHIALGLDVGTTVQQQAHHILIAGESSVVQRRCSILQNDNCFQRFCSLPARRRYFPHLRIRHQGGGALLKRISMVPLDWTGMLDGGSVW